jgi:hypothetical protein
MKRIALKGRTLLRKLFTGLSLGAVSLVFQACYGPAGIDPSDNQECITGTVKASDTAKPITGIKVSLANAPEGRYDITDNEGAYWLYVPEGTAYTVLFEDIDGEMNGCFQKKEVAWTPAIKKLDVLLDACP